MPSAISTPTFQALAGNIKNADGTTAVYSLGAWTFKNSSAVTTFAISDAGAVTVGITGSTSSSLKYDFYLPTASSFGAFSGTDPFIRFGSPSSDGVSGIIGYQNGSSANSALRLYALSKDTNTQGDMVFDVRENDNSSFATTGNKAFVFSHNGTSLLEATRAGAVTLGPAAFTSDTKHTVNGQMPNIAGAKIAVSTSATTLIDFNNRPAGMYLVSVVRSGGSVGTNGTYIVGYTGGSGGTVAIYATISSNGCTASASTTMFKMLIPSGTENLYANAFYLVGGS